MLALSIDKIDRIPQIQNPWPRPILPGSNTTRCPGGKLPRQQSIPGKSHSPRRRLRARFQPIGFIGLQAGGEARAGRNPNSKIYPQLIIDAQTCLKPNFLKTITIEAVPIDNWWPIHLHIKVQPSTTPPFFKSTPLPPGKRF
jgi:hypothetical protein